MIWKDIHRIIRTYETIIRIEKRVSITERRIFFLILGFVVVGSVCALLLFDIYEKLFTGLFFLGAGLWVLLFMYELYIRSKYFAHITDGYRTDTKNSQTVLSFDLADIFVSAEGKDMVLGLFHSFFGQELRVRLGVSKKDIEDFLDRKSHILVPQQLDYTEFELSTLGLTSYMIKKDHELQEFLLGYGILTETFLGTVLWVIAIRTKEKKHDMWWMRESLRRIPSIGKQWALGELPFLKKFSLEVGEVPEYNDFTEENSLFGDTTEEIEHILAGSKTANVMLVGDDTYAKTEPIFLLNKRIERGTIHPELEKKRMFFLYHDRIFAAAEDRQDVENIIVRLFTEIAQAEEVIVVIPEFDTFVKVAGDMSIDVIELLRPYISSPVVQVIGLTNTREFESEFRTNHAVSELFEAVFVTEHGRDALFSFVQSDVLLLEKREKVFFTFVALKELTEQISRLYSGSDHLSRIQALLGELAGAVRRDGRSIVLRRDVEEMLHVKTGIPGSTVSQEEKAKLLELETLLHKRVVGQERAVRSVAETLRRARSGIRNQEKPIGSFLFLGPTGVGKTEMARSLAAVFFDGEDNMIRFDMTEFSGDDALARLIGDYASGKPGLLVSKLRENPYGILLLDEFEKASRAVHDLFLQILDEGVFSDMRGERVSARNTIIIATSNAGSDLVWRRMKEDPNKDIRDEVIDYIIAQQILRPELINRFDGVIVFHPLMETHVEKVAERMLEKLAERMSEQGYTLSFSHDLVTELVHIGSDPKFGARPIARAITERVEGAIARKILEGNLQLGNTVELSAADLA